MGCDSQFDQPVSHPLTKEEKVTNVENKLDGKVTYTDLEDAKKTLKKSIATLEEKQEEYYKLSADANTAERARDQARRNREEAEESLKNLIYKWQKQ